MSSIASLYTGLSAADEHEVSRAIAALNENFGETSTLHFIETIFKLGSVRVVELLRAADTSANHGESSGRQFGFILRETDTAVVETSTASTSFEAGARFSEAMSEAGLRSATVMACKCYRKVPYKTARGFREHLVLKHGLTALEAEVKANLTFHESNSGSIQPQNESNGEQTPAAAGVHELMNDGSQSQGVDYWEAFFADQEPYQPQTILDRGPTPGSAGGYGFGSDESQTCGFGF